MNDRVEALREANRRGLLPPEMKAAFEEAERRGLIGAQAAPMDEAPPSKPTFGSEVSAVASQGIQGLAEGLGAPVDAMAGFWNTVASSYGHLVGDMGWVINPPFPNPVGGSESIKQGLKAVGIEERQPQTMPGRVAGRAAEFVGELAGPYGAVAAAPKIGVKAGPIMNEMINSPGKQAVASAAAGAGSGVAQEFSDNPWIEMGGMLLGGLAPSAAGTTGRLAVNLLKGAFEPFLKGGRQRIVGNTLDRMATNPDEARLNLRDAEELVPGSRPTTAQAAMDPGLATAERGVRSGDPRTGGAFAMRDAEQAQARRDFISGTVPTDAGVGNVTAAIQERLRSFEGATDEIIRRTTDRALARVAMMGDDIDPETAGRILREEFEAAKGASRFNVSRLYEGIDPTDASRFSIQPLYTEIADSVNGMFGRSTKGVPAELSAVVNRLRGDQMSFADLNAIAQDFGEIAGKASASGDNRLASVAGSAQKNIQAYIERNADSGFTPDQAARYKAARQARAEQGRIFEEGASGVVGDKNQYGRYDKYDSDVADKWFTSRSHSSEAARQFVEALGGRPRAVETMESYAASKLREFATREDGTIDPKKWRAWMQKHMTALQPFPELVEKMRTAGKANELVERLVGRRARALEDVQKSAAGFFLERDPDKAVDAVFKGSRPAQDMRSLVMMVSKDPDALNGLRRAVIDRMQGRVQNSSVDAAGELIDSFDKFRKFISDNRAVLAELYTPDQLRNLTLVADDMKRGAFAQSAGRAVGSNTMQNLSTGNLIARVLGGLIAPNNSFAQSITRAIQWMYRMPEAQIQELLTEAMLDPQLAYMLMQKATPSRVKEASERIASRLTATYGSAAIGVNQDEPKSTIEGPLRAQ